MTATIDLTRHGDADGKQIDVLPPAPAPRFHALDCVRATAMMLGIFYHLPTAMMGGGFGMGSFGMGSPKTSIDNWLHSFRMALFFLISGFFANMMLGKYGFSRYLARRWWRIGAPLLVALFAFGVLRSFAPSVMPPAFGGMMAAPPGNFNQIPKAAPTQPPAAGAAAPMPWQQPGAMAPAAPNFPGPRPNPAVSAQTFAPPDGMALPSFMAAPSRAAANRLFGKYAPNFSLEHLWFLWYLLIFVTVAPLVAIGFSYVFARSALQVDRLGGRMLRFDVLGLILALISLPALIHARGFFNWTLTNPAGFMGTFPDFLWQYYPDLPFYFVYFLFGWWIYRLRSNLNDLGRTWLWNVSLGIAAFAISQWMSDKYAAQAGFGLGWVAVCGYVLYAIGSAYSAFGLLGLFQRYLDRPTRLGRYFTDTMLWVYLVQLAIIPHVIMWIEPWRTAWWESSLAGMVIVVAIALVLFELFVRPTPLVHIFGPPQRRAVRPALSAAATS